MNPVIYFYLYFNRSIKRNLHLSNFHTTACRTPKMANAVSQAVAQRQQPPREAPAAESSRREVRHAEGEQDEAEDEVTCFKEVVPGGGSQLNTSSQQQRDVAVLMADTPSPAPSVISIHSDLSDGDDEKEEEEAHLPG